MNYIIKIYSFNLAIDYNSTNLIPIFYYLLNLMDDTNNLINFLMPSSDRPDSLYKQLSRSLNRAIQQGLLTPGDALMPERELASKAKYV